MVLPSKMSYPALPKVRTVRLPPAALETGWGFTNVIYWGVVGQEGIKPNNQLESDLECNSLAVIHDEMMTVFKLSRFQRIGGTL